MPAFQFAVPTTRIATVNAATEAEARALLSIDGDVVTWGAEDIDAPAAVLVDTDG